MRTFISGLTFLLLWFAAQGQAILPPLLFAGMDGEHILDDGSSLPFWGYGYSLDGFITLPAPLLTYTQGTNNSLSFINESPEGHTIHLHGLDVNQNNDGVPSTSFTVMPNQQASYAFNAQHTGTYFYHCHVTTTLHLTMGMYGMILITRPDGTLWEEGPAYDRDIDLLFSDLEVEVNLDPTGAFPFHTIRPNYFMVNGLSGNSLTANSDVAAAVPGERVALRLGSMAYSKVSCTFPDEWNAQLVMSDGRPLPEAMSPGVLDIYPGERYTVLIDAPESQETNLSAEFLSMVNGSSLSTQSVWLNTSLVQVKGEPAAPTWSCFPNPVSERLHANLPEGNWRIADGMGRFHSSGLHTGGTWSVNVEGWPSGIYFLHHTGGQSAKFFVN
jgi:FtsP/CotA-like multicopper oxidase with cupredoxin domain